VYDRAELWFSSCGATTPAHSTDWSRVGAGDLGRNSPGRGPGSSPRRPCPGGCVPEDRQPHAAFGSAERGGMRGEPGPAQDLPSSGLHSQAWLPWDRRQGQSQPLPSDPSQATVASVELEETKSQPWQRLEELLAEVSLSRATQPALDLSPWHTAGSQITLCNLARRKPRDSAPRGRGVLAGDPQHLPQDSPGQAQLKGPQNGRGTSLRAVPQQ